MRSAIFAECGLSGDADYDFDVGSHRGLPVVNFRAPGSPLQMIELSRAALIKQKFAKAGDIEGAKLFENLIKDAELGLVGTAPLYVDPTRAATMDDGAHTERFLTLREAKMAWDGLLKERQEIATIASAGRTYTRDEIDRFHSQRRS